MEASRVELISPAQPGPGGRASRTPDPWDDEEPLNLWPTVLSLWQRRWMILGGTAIVAAVAFASSVLSPKEYTALATVFVTPPTLASDLKPTPFSVEAYERLADSDFIKSRVAEELRRQRLIGADELPARLETIIYPSREPQKPFLPLIGLQAIATDPERARTAANVWASVFVDEQSRLATAGKSGSVDFILEEFPKASAKVLEAESKLKAIEDRQGKALAALKTRLGVSLKTAQLFSAEDRIVEFESDLANARVAAQSSKAAVPKLEQELARTPQTVSTAKSISDDALWITAVNGAKPGEAPRVPDAVAGSHLQTQEINPVFLDVSQQLADRRIAYDTSTIKEQILTKQLQDAKREAAATRADVLASELALDDLDRQQTLERAAYQRSVDEANARFEKLNQKIGDAQLVKAERESNVKVGALAEKPSKPSSPDPVRRTLMAVPIGLLVSAIVVWLTMQVRRRSRSVP
jgi:uncharacterized protein involved in exopolysaccharide biosynthesis